MSCGKSKFDILLRNPSVERKKIMTTNIISPSPTSDSINSKKGRGYFYESVGGVYYTLEWPLKSSPSSSADHNGIAITNGNEDDNVSSQEKEKNGKF